MKPFEEVSCSEHDIKWEKAIERISPIEQKKGEIRSEFTRDYNRILHCTAYRRLRNKTQVFFSPKNENICTRIEHVNHVTSVSNTISNFLGLNSELTNAIAIGHDLGHAPFGHSGERCINNITQKYLKKPFNHEKNSLRVVSDLEILENSNAELHNLNLTYAVRDGIVAHCGEVDEVALFPRDDHDDLELYQWPSKTAPFTWEACVVKISDKISYLGRDMEDAIRMQILDRDQVEEFNRILGRATIKHLNNTTLMHTFVVDLCNNSSPKTGIRLSDNLREVMNDVKRFNYNYIYGHRRLVTYEKYAELIINSVCEYLLGLYNGVATFNNLTIETNIHKNLPADFKKFISFYTKQSRTEEAKNRILYDLENKNDYIAAVVDFLASLTDRNAIEYFEELIRF